MCPYIWPPCIYGSKLNELVLNLVGAMYSAQLDVNSLKAALQGLELDVNSLEAALQGLDCKCFLLHFNFAETQQQLTFCFFVKRVL